MKSAAAYVGGASCCLLLTAHPCGAAEPPQGQCIGSTAASELKISGPAQIDHGQTLLCNGSTVTAGGQEVKIALVRGGELRLCATTSVHLAQNSIPSDPGSRSLLVALDRGALEASYAVGKYADVLLTPDLRILISGPGQANLSIRVNTAGDTCIHNRGAEAPYVTVSSQLDGGAYRVEPDQRVTFEHGSLRQVVDREPEPCGCPKPQPAQAAAGGGKTPAGGPSSTPADTAFPLAESEGLASPPPPPKQPVVPPGEAHAEVTVPLTYNGQAAPPSTGAAGSAPAGANGSAASTPAPEAKTAAAPPKRGQPGFFHRIGHFFAHLFGR